MLNYVTMTFVLKKGLNMLANLTPSYTSWHLVTHKGDGCISGNVIVGSYGHCIKTSEMRLV